jgi:hypothetical protein
MKYVRRLWYWLIRYNGETCDDCGLRYDRFLWFAPTELWTHLHPRYGGCLCPGCFDKRARDKGLLLQWAPQVANSKQNNWENHLKDAWPPPLLGTWRP